MLHHIRHSVYRCLDTAAPEIEFGERGYLIDAKGEATPIHALYGHEAFVRNRGGGLLSVMDFVVDKGWVLFERDKGLVELTLCPESVYQSAVATALKIVNGPYKQEVFTIREYECSEDRDIERVSKVSSAKASNWLVKLKIFLKKRQHQNLR